LCRAARRDARADLLANPTLIRAEIDRRLDQLRTADPTTAQRQRLEQALAKASASITRLIKAYQEELISLDELRERMPELRSRETNLRNQLDALAAHLVDREVYLQLATGLEDFLAQLRNNAATTNSTPWPPSKTSSSARTYPHPPLHPRRRQNNKPHPEAHRR
jgi:site-specific DNA recombinase